MSIEDIRKQLLECAGHLDAVGDQLRGPINQGLEAANEYLGATAIALEVALEKLDLAARTFEGLEEAGKDTDAHARAAIKIIRSSGFIKRALPESRELPKLTHDIATQLPGMGSSGALAKRRDTITGIIEQVNGHKEAWEENRELIVDSGEVTQEWSAHIRNYLEGL